MNEKSRHLMCQRKFGNIICNVLCEKKTEIQIWKQTFGRMLCDRKTQILKKKSIPRKQELTV